MRTRNNGQAAVFGRGEPPPSSRLPGRRILGRGRISCGLSQNLWSAYPDASSSGGCVWLPSVRSLRTGLFCFFQPVSVCRSGGPAAEHRRRNSMKKRIRLLPMLAAVLVLAVLCAAPALRKAARRTNRVRAWWNARNAAARALAWNAPRDAGVRAGEKHLRGLRRSADRGGRRFCNTAWSLLPPLIAITLALIKQKRCILHCL